MSQEVVLHVSHNPASIKLDTHFLPHKVQRLAPIPYIANNLNDPRLKHRKDANGQFGNKDIFPNLFLDNRFCP